MTVKIKKIKYSVVLFSQLTDNEQCDSKILAFDKLI